MKYSYTTIDAETQSHLPHLHYNAAVTAWYGDLSGTGSADLIAFNGKMQNAFFHVEGYMKNVINLQNTRQCHKETINEKI